MSEISQDFFKEAIDELIDIAKPNSGKYKYLWFPHTKKYPFVKDFDTSTKEGKKQFERERKDALSLFSVLGIIESDDMKKGMQKNGYCPLFSLDADRNLEKIKQMISEHELNENAFLDIKKNQKRWSLKLDMTKQKMYEIENGEKREIHSFGHPSYLDFWKYLFENIGIPLKKSEMKRILNTRNVVFSDYLKNSKITEERKSRYFPEQKNNRMFVFQDTFIEK